MHPKRDRSVDLGCPFVRAKGFYWLDVMRLRWDHATGDLWASGRWGEDSYTLRRVLIEDGSSLPVDPPVVFGRNFENAVFDLSPDCGLVVYTREKDVKGNIWVLEAETGTY